jgi:hypothetical protein
MPALPEGTINQLASSHGYTVVAGSREIGRVETPTFADGVATPDHLIIRTGDEIPGTFRIVSASLVAGLETERRLVVLGVDVDFVASLPEHLPLGRY